MEWGGVVVDATSFYESGVGLVWRRKQCVLSSAFVFVQKKLSETRNLMTLFSTEKTYGALRGNVLNDTFLLRWFGGDHRNRKFSFSPLRS